MLARMRIGSAAITNDLLSLTAETGTDREHLAAAVEWLCTSQDVTDSGGSAATYNLVLGWEDAYPETTGYIVPTMFAAAEAMDDPDLAERAIRMADWLCTVQRSGGGFPGGTDTTNDPNVFNTGQIVLGLTSAYRETGDQRYRTAVERACDWLVDQQTAGGYWDSYDYNDQAHAYATRVAWSLLEGATVLPDRATAYRDAARRNLHWAVDCQRPNGWFEHAAFESGETPFLHTIAYTIRGLLEGGLELSDGTAVDAATRAADELLSRQQTDGILKGAYDETWSPSWYYCLTGNAQMALVWLRLFDQTGERTYRFAARRTIEFLKRRQVLAGPAAIRGGLAGSHPVVGRYLYLRFPNWGVKFFADALLQAESHTTARPAGNRPN